MAPVDDVRVPDDAGEYADALARVLARIPASWGRVLRCGKGWYPIIVKLDQAISELSPDYEIQQIKEKYGTLSFYWEFKNLTAACCLERYRIDPRPVEGPVSGPAVPATRTSAEQALLDAWDERHQRHVASKKCEAGWAALAPELDRQDEVRDLIDELVTAAELESARTCESCGAPGSLNTSRPWVRTLCLKCSQGHS